MKRLSLLFTLLFLPLALFAADSVLKIDPARSYVDVDIKSTTDSFTARLEKYETNFSANAAGKIKSAGLTFKFTDLKTGKPDRDAKMIDWLGGGVPEGKFEAGIVVVAPDGQGQVNGKLTFHGRAQQVEFPVQVSKEDGTYTLTGEATIDYREWDLKVIRMMGLLKVDPFVTIKFKFTGTLPAAPKEE